MATYTYGSLAKNTTPEAIEALRALYAKTAPPPRQPAPAPTPREP